MSNETKMTLEKASNYAAEVGADAVLANCCPDGVQTYELPTSPMQTTSIGPQYYQINGARIVPWNWHISDNAFPYVADLILNSDKDANPTIKRKVNYMLGKGKLTLYKNGKKVMLPDDHEINIWLTQNRRKLKKFNKCNAINYCRYGNYFCSFVLTRMGKVFNYKALKPHNVRSEEISEMGEIDNYYVYKESAYTHTISSLGSEHTKLPGFNEAKFSPNGIYIDSQFVYHGGLIAPEDQYNRPEWLGGTTQLQLRREIINYYNAGLRNGFNVRFLILFHQKFYEIEGLKTPEERKAKKQEVVEGLNQFLSGTANTGKALAVDTVYDHIGKQYKGLIEIVPINNSVTDDNYSKILERSDSATPANFGISSILAGIERPGALSKGTEAIQQHNMHVKVHVPDDRETILEPIYLIFELNGWATKYADLYDEIGFEDVLLESSNKNEITTQ